jgi:mono/diheme cytochrome c family protein
MTHQSPINRQIKFGWIALVLAGGLFLAGCAEIGQMRDQPRYDTMQGSDFFSDGASARVPPDGSVPYSVDISPSDPSVTGTGANGEPVERIPVEVNEELLARGAERFEIFCVPCHGPTGEGNGKVTAFGFPKPASLIDENAKALSAGEIFDVISNGKGNMFPYGYRIKPPDRWAVISYVRALQLKNGAVNLDELTPEDINQIGEQP